MPKHAGYGQPPPKKMAFGFWSKNQPRYHSKPQGLSTTRSKMNVLSKYVSNLFGVAVDSMEEEREAETENCSGEERREHSDLLPADLNPRIHKEAHRKHHENNEAWTGHMGTIITTDQCKVTAVLCTI